MVERVIAFLLGGVTALAAAAQPLSDPTRPPGARTGEAFAPAPAPTRLQSVLIGPERSIAVIDGRAVALGERVGEAIVVSIAPSEVVLRRGADYQTLKLLPPGVEKKAVKP